VTLEAFVLGQKRAAFCTRGVRPSEVSGALTLELSRDFLDSPVVWATRDEVLAGVPQKIHYGRPELDSDRRVTAVLEIDWFSGTQRPPLAVKTYEGQLSLEDVFAAVGISMEVRWDDEVPFIELGDRRFPEPQAVRPICERHRNAEVEKDQWHLYLLLGTQTQQGTELSYLINEDQRLGAMVFLNPDPVHPGENLHAIVHELGHLLNLPHPWETYGASRSAMAYPWQWGDWDWNDSSVYRFDPVAQHHILRAPEDAVRPGRSAFLDYGTGTAAAAEGGPGRRTLPLV
jgi:hypothetical protein